MKILTDFKRRVTRAIKKLGYSSQIPKILVKEISASRIIATASVQYKWGWNIDFIIEGNIAYLARLTSEQLNELAMHEACHLVMSFLGYHDELHGQKWRNLMKSQGYKPRAVYDW